MPRSQTPAHVSPADRIAAAIIDRLEAGVRPWVKPWSAGPRLRPLRACGEPYRGLNLFWLWLVAETRGYASRYWMTYRQAAALGGQVRRGERSVPAIFFKPAAPAGDEPNNQPRPVLRSYSIFNADQIEGLPEPLRAPSPAPPPWDRRCAPVAAFFDRLPGEVRLGGDVAGYDAAADVIHLPLPARFRSPEAFYATLAHERAHWTGHAGRLARDFGARFGDDAYAFEELTAELASAILGAELGLPVEHLDDHAAYIGAWIRVLEASPRTLLAVAGKAQAAADFLLAAGGAGGSAGEGRDPGEAAADVATGRERP